MRFGRWAQELWDKSPHPMSEKAARDLVWKLCSDGDLVHAWVIVEQMRYWAIHSIANYDKMQLVLAWWDGAWHVLLGITVTERKYLANHRLQRVRGDR